MSQRRKDDDTQPWRPPSRQMGSNGRITEESPPASVNKPEPPKPEAQTSSELVLDKSKFKNRPGFVEPPDYRPTLAPIARRPVKWVLLLLALGAAAIALFVLAPGLQRKLSLPSGTKGTLVIHSDPPGAKVKIAGTVIGQTPWAGDNLWGGRVPYEISAPGYRPSTGAFGGGEDVTLKVNLLKK